MRIFREQKGAITPRQEAFCTFIVTGDDQTEAYRKAFKCPTAKPSTIYTKASRLMDDERIKARIEELRAPVREKVQLTLETHLARLNTLGKAAETKENYGAAINAEALRGKAVGLYVERSELTGKNGRPLFGVTDLSDEERDARLIALLRKAQGLADARTKTKKAG